MSDFRSFTPTELKLLQVLSDGLPHSKAELRSCLPDDLSATNVAQRHISSIRKILRPRGEDIICEFANRSIFYRHVRLLASAVDGYT